MGWFQLAVYWHGICLRKALNRQPTKSFRFKINRKAHSSVFSVGCCECLTPMLKRRIANFAVGEDLVQCIECSYPVGLGEGGVVEHHVD